MSSGRNTGMGHIVRQSMLTRLLNPSATAIAPGADYFDAYTRANHARTHLLNRLATLAGAHK